MKSRLFLSMLLLILFTGFLHAQTPIQQETINFNSNWEFAVSADTSKTIAPAVGTKGQQLSWGKVSLPHTPRIEPIEKKEEQWQGTCFYQKVFPISEAQVGKNISIQFDGAMHEAELYVNGKFVSKHLGGYLPFYTDITSDVRIGQNTVLVKLNNQDNATIPPGKAIKDLDFNYYGGIYRNAWLIIKDKLHISNAVAVGHEAGGGVLLHYENVSENSATMQLQTEVVNGYPQKIAAQTRLILKDRDGKEIANVLSGSNHIASNGFATFQQQITIKNPKLWSPDAPYLYSLIIQAIKNGKVVDESVIKTGVKTWQFAVGAFRINGRKVNIRGTNRHQEYPYIGYALSDNAQYRDAYKIKQAGFNFVRCSHYPPSPAFLDACDELGIMVMNSIPGWQFFGNETFQENSFQNIRDMVHRDRNHASIILWEASLNETGMSKDYMQQSHNIVHKELPFKDVYTCGWKEDAYDVFIPARQHAKAPFYWNRYVKKPLLIAEYGDWEYYAQNAGFNQKEYQDLKAEERTSRQLRASGEKGMLQQALNFQEAHNDDLNGSAVGDANWLMFDYKRGYAQDLEMSGIMDINRLPKFAFYFYQSQCLNPSFTTENPFGKPMVFIADYWNNPATKTVKIFGNCDEVEFFINDKKIARQRPNADSISNKLDHPPFTFKIDKYQAGTITAVGYLNGKEVARTEQRTPGKAASIKLVMDTSGKPVMVGKPDAVFVYAQILDANGTIIPNADDTIHFKMNGKAELVGANPVKAEAGIATILLRTSSEGGKLTLSASASGLKTAVLNIMPVKMK